MSIASILFGGCFKLHIARRVPEQSTAPPDSVSTIAQIERSVFPIVCVQRPKQNGGDDTLLSVEGTAFFIDRDGTFATAGHVIGDLTAQGRRSPCEQPAFYLPVGGWHPEAPSFRITTFYFSQADCARDEQIDIAVCKSQGPGELSQRIGSEPDPLNINANLLPDGTPAAFTGFPLQAVTPITSRGFIAAYRGATDDAGPRELLIDKPNWPGASGSPIYLENGSVIGILVQRGVGEGAGITIGRPAKFIERLRAQRRR